MVIKGSLPHFYRKVLFSHYPNLQGLHQVKIRIEDKEALQLKNTCWKNSQFTQNPNTYTRTAEVNFTYTQKLAINALNWPTYKHYKFSLPLSKVFQRL